MKDWEKETVINTVVLLERAIVLSMNRIEEAAKKRPELNKEATQYHEVGPHFDQECATLINLLNARREEYRASTKASDPKPR
jgi:hypothetical protein